MALPGRQRRAVFALTAPFFAFFILAFVAPIAYAIYESLLKVNRSGPLGLGGSSLEFAGFSNYALALRQTDFIQSFLRVLLFGVVQVPTMIVLATGLALLLEMLSSRWAAFFRTVYFLPYGVPGVIASLLWGFLYVPGVSPVVTLFHDVGINVNFLGYHTILWSIANIAVWEFAGYNMLIIVAQLKSIPHDLIEAARVDGAGLWRINWHVRLPLIKPALTLTLVFSIIGTLQLFTEPEVLTTYTGYITTNYTPNLSAYNQSFTNNNTNLASAEAVILAVVAAVLSFGFLKLVTRRTNR
ncbi:MAG TPA: sugar ABC transporter permease [Mycobacteriales bacterium]|jgi:multiple sugar transport system permease protein|nr:sugar ABC transporter permease [Mycobacteriales bacterium]